MLLYSLLYVLVVSVDCCSLLFVLFCGVVLLSFVLLYVVVLFFLSYLCCDVCRILLLLPVASPLGQSLGL